MQKFAHSHLIRLTGVITMTSHELKFEAIEVRMNTGDFTTAERLARNLVNKCVSIDDVYRAMHLRGINLRLLGRHAEAEVELLLVIARGNDFSDKTLAPRARRDLGMVYLEEKRLGEAAMQMVKSFNELTALGEIHEAAISRGFSGRVSLANGERDVAYLDMKLADEVLRTGNNPSDTLNNLIWMMKTAGPVRRQQLRKRALVLAGEVGTTQRAREAQIIAISPRGYELLKWLKKH